MLGGKGKDVMIMADPDFDLPMKEKDKVLTDLGIKVAKRSDGTRASASQDMRGLGFKRLGGTKGEAKGIEEIVGKRYNVRSYLDKKAIEEVLYSIKEPPEILHLATHGFFLSDVEIKGIASHRKGLGLWGNLTDYLSGQEAQDMTIENPMLRSGIALAGANTSIKEGRDDGIVTAEKVTGLNLAGTGLVVLSACDTAVGVPKAGEGVFGLKRSFILAGAETLVMSLWKVPDEETKNLMVEFYELMMQQGKDKAEALRQARLKMKKAKPHPYYWGAFICVGKPD